MDLHRKALHNKRLLIVEDEPTVAMDYVATLTSAGAKVVTTARTAAQAIDHVQHDPVDAAVLDFVLGDNNSSTLQTVLAERRIPFVVVSGYPPVLVRSGREQQVLRKPVAPDHLCAAVVAACDATRNKQV